MQHNLPRQPDFALLNISERAGAGNALKPVFPWSGQDQSVFATSSLLRLCKARPEVKNMV